MATTPTNAQWNKGTATTKTITINDLTPGEAVVIGVRAKGKDSSGNDIYSDYVTINYTVPGTGQDGTNLINVNKNTDIRLQGGAIYAQGTGDAALPKNIGQLDLFTFPITGSGVIFNQSGIAAFNNGVQEFALNGKTGQATFRGTVSLGTQGFKIGPNVLNGKAGIYINPNNYWLDDGTLVATQKDINDILTGAKSTKPGAISNLTGIWQGQDILLSFNFDTTTKDLTTDPAHPIDNTIVKRVKIGFKLTSTSIPIFVDGTLNPGTSHSFRISRSYSQTLFAIWQSSIYQISVTAVDIYGNEGASSVINLDGSSAHQSLLPSPNISVADMPNGYSVTFNNYPSIATYPEFVDVVIEDVIAADDINPATTGFNAIWEGTASGSPAIVNVLSSSYEHRWVRARYRRNDGSLTNPSSPAKLAKPQNPVASGLNTQQPDTPGNVVATWSGDNISIAYTATGTSGLTSRFIIILTATDGTNVFQGSFYKYPIGSLGSTPLIITSDELYNQFGAYYTTYSGTLFQEYSETAIRSNGASFVTPVKQSLLTGVVPSLSNIGIFSIPGGYAVTPTNFPVGAVGVNIYQSDTGALGTYNFVKQIRYLSTVTLLDSNTHYVKVKYAGITGDESNFSSYVAVQSINPTSSTPTPFPPYISDIMPEDITETNISITLTPSDADYGLNDITRGYYVQYYPDGHPELMIMNMVPASGVTPAMYLIPNLIPGKTYKISAAAYNDSNVLSDYTTEISVTTDSSVVYPPTNVQLSAIAYGVLASWTPPATAAISIANYNVSAYYSTTPSGTYTLLYDSQYQNQLTPGQSFSFAGLKGSLYYKVAVSSVDIYGNKSSTQTFSSNYIYLNSSGGSSDINRPTSNPTTVTPKSVGRAIQVNWSAISNPDPVTYELHVSTTPNFSPSTSYPSTTRVTETAGLFGIIAKDPALNTDLTYSTTTSTTTYYITVLAKDVDGYATGGYAYASTTVTQVSTADVAYNSIGANQITAGSITSYHVDANNLLVSKLFTVGSGSNAIKIDTTGSGSGLTPYKLYSGTGSYSDINTPFYLDSIGRFSLKNSLTYDITNGLMVAGEIRASKGYFTGSVTLNGASPAIAMKIGKGVDTTTLKDGIYLDSTNYWYSDGTFKIGSSTAGATWNGTTLNVIGLIDATGGYFSGPVQINTTSNGALVVGASQTTGPRVIVNKSGIFAYSYGATTSSAPTTYINVPANTSTPTFQTTYALIGGYSIDAVKVQAYDGTSYFGMSNASVGSAFYAGGPDGGGLTSKFHVGSDGSVVARNLQLLGDGTTNSKLNIGAAVVSTTATGSASTTIITVGSATGISAGMFVYATNIIPNTTVKSIVGTTVTLSQATTGAVAGAASFIPAATSTHIMPNGTIYTYASVISGNSYLTGAYISGNLNMSTIGSVYSGTVINPGQPGNTNAYPILSGAGFILNTKGITFAGTSGTFTTTIDAGTGTLVTNQASIGGWTVNRSQIISPNSSIYIDANIASSNTTPTTSSLPAIYASAYTYYVGMTPITGPSNAASDVVLWAGGYPYSSRSLSNFRVYGDGHVYIGGTGSIIDGGVTIGGASRTLTDLNTTANSANTTANSAQTTANSANTTANSANTTANSAYSGLANKLEKTGNIITNASNQLTAIDMSGVTVYNANGSTNGTIPTTGPFIKLNSSGIVANNGTKNTIVIGSDGNASFAGTLSAASGTFSGDISVGSGNSVFISDSNGIYLGNSTFASAPFSVTRGGAINAISGYLGGFDITNGDFKARLNVGPRIMFTDSSLNDIIKIGWDSGSFTSPSSYVFQVGYNSTHLFKVSTAANVNRASIDTTRTTYALEVLNAVRARDLYYDLNFGATPSSRRFKENIKYAPKSFYDRILNIRPAFFTYLESHPEIEPEMANVHSFGLIAEDLEAAGLGYFVERNMEGLPSRLMNTHELPQLLIPIVKELKDQIIDLTNRLERLENK